MSDITTRRLLASIIILTLIIGLTYLPIASGQAGGVDGCSSWAFTNDRAVYPRCIIIDTEPPKIVKAFVTPSDYVCVETHDNTQTVKVTYNGKQVPRWSGSNIFFCTNEELPEAIRVVAEDIAGNSSEIVAINRQRIFQTGVEETFVAERSVTLNPHHSVEGMVLFAKVPIKQIRIATSPDFGFKELHVSDYALKELYGHHTITVTYKGQYANTQYGKELHGYLYVFASNIGHLATFDVVVKDDIILYQHQQKQTHKPYNLDLQNVSVLDEMNLNIWQKAELEKIFAGNGELTIVQKNILVKLLR